MNVPPHPRPPALLLLSGVVLAASATACVVPSRMQPQNPPQYIAPGPVDPPPAQPVSQVHPGPLTFGVAPPPARDACETTYLPPFDGAMAWRTAYRGSAAGVYHHCPGWSTFGPVRPNRKWHRGVDIAAVTGTPIRSATSGTLSYGRDPNGWGLYARVRFTPSTRGQSGTCESGAPMEFIYAHLLEDIPAGVLRAEQPISAGTMVGRVGCSGNARGMCSPSLESHLHLTLRHSNGKREKVDPLPVAKWNLVEPSPEASSPPMLACPLASGQTSASRK